MRIERSVGARCVSRGVWRPGACPEECGGLLWDRGGVEAGCVSLVIFECEEEHVRYGEEVSCRSGI